MAAPPDSVRIDQWLWAVRLYKTRTAATDACRGRHVRLNGSPVKAASPLEAGDLVEARIGGRHRVVEVVRLIDKRAAATVAAGCLIDRSPPPPSEDERRFARNQGAGRPTKRDRRRLDRLRA